MESPQRSGWDGRGVRSAGGRHRSDAALKGLPDDLCQRPHWGCAIEGKLGIRYTDGSEEIVSAGSVFYMPPGHTAWMEADTAFIDFSPEREYAETAGHATSQV